MFNRSFAYTIALLLTLPVLPALAQPLDADPQPVPSVRARAPDDAEPRARAMSQILSRPAPASSESDGPQCSKGKAIYHRPSDWPDISPVWRETEKRE